MVASTCPVSTPPIVMLRLKPSGAVTTPPSAMVRLPTRVVSDTTQVSSAATFLTWMLGAARTAGARATSSATTAHMATRTVMKRFLLLMPPSSRRSDQTHRLRRSSAGDCETDHRQTLVPGPLRCARSFCRSAAYSESRNIVPCIRRYNKRPRNANGLTPYPIDMTGRGHDDRPTSRREKCGGPTCGVVKLVTAAGVAARYGRLRRFARYATNSSAVFSCLRRLHMLQTQERFSGQSVPPRLSGVFRSRSYWSFRSFPQ